MTPPTHVWYACYGPSLSRSTFLQYVLGGTSPSGRLLPGCRDRSLPGGDVNLTIPQPLYLSGVAASWDGAPVFVDPYGVGPGTLARAYLLTLPQLADVLAQELGEGLRSRLDVTGLASLLNVAGRDGVAEAGPGMFEALVSCGTVAGFPVAAFTASWRREQVGAVPFDAALLDPTLRGLEEAWGLRRDESLSYLGLLAPAAAAA